MSNTFEINSVKSDNIDMEYLKFGSGEKNLVIIPGLSIKSVLLSAEGVVSAYNAFADDYTVYLFDRNKIIREHYTVDDMAEETAFAIKTIGIKNADFFGVSQGGMIAECIAIKYPELVHKMVLGSTMARVNETVKRIRRKI